MPSTPTLLQLFEREAAKVDAAPERLALYIAGMAYPTLNIESELLRLDQLARRAARSLADTPPGETRATQFLSIINDEFEFDGNHHDYYDVRNSFLNEVLDRKLGLPITLSVVCIAIGRRLHESGLDLQIHGLGLPNHFMVRYKDSAGIWLLDPFNGAVLVPNDAGAYLARMSDDFWDGREVTIPPELLHPISAPMLAYRILNNLRVVYLHQERLKSVMWVLDFMLALAPDDITLWRERGLLHYQSERWDLAERDLRRYFFLKNKILVSFLHAEHSIVEHDEEIDQLSQEDQNLLYVLHDIEQILSRIN